MNKAFEALFYHYVRELGKKGEYNVSLDLQRKMTYERFAEARREKEMEDRITQNVLSRISASADVSQAVKEVKKLQDEIQKL